MKKVSNKKCLTHNFYEEELEHKPCLTFHTVALQQQHIILTGSRSWLLLNYYNIEQ